MPGGESNVATTAQLTESLSTAPWSFRNYFLDSSNGKVDYAPVVAPWSTYDATSAALISGHQCYATADDPGVQWDTALRTRVLNKVDQENPSLHVLTDFKHYIFLTPPPYRGLVNGQPTFSNNCPGGAGEWVYQAAPFDSRSTGILVHETMHVLGLNHGATLNCVAPGGAQAPVSSSCLGNFDPDHGDGQNSQGGDTDYTLMNGLHRLYTGFMSTDNVLSVIPDPSGSTIQYPLNNIEKTVPNTTTQLLRIGRTHLNDGDYRYGHPETPAQTPYYYVEYQRPLKGYLAAAGLSDSLLRGVTIRRGPVATSGTGYIPPGGNEEYVPRTINPTVGRGVGRLSWNARSRFYPVDGQGFRRLDPDVTLKVGQSLWDPVENYTITNQSMTADTANISVRQGGPTTLGAMVSLTSGKLSAIQSGSAASDIVVSKQGTSIYVADYGRNIQVTSPCVKVDVQTASCPAATVTSLDLRGGSGDDTIAVTDSVVNSSNAGIPANLVGGAGNDSLEGGKGNDTLDGGLGADAIDGGDGLTDTVVYSNRTNPVDASPGARPSVSETEGRPTVVPSDVQERGKGEVGENDGISKETERSNYPTVNITSGPENGSWFNGSTPVKYSFTSSLSGTTFECSSTGTANFAPCTSPWTVPTPSTDKAVGTYIRAFKGTLRSTDTYRVVGFDRVTPVPQITSGPAADATIYGSNMATFTVAVAAETGFHSEASLGCRIDDGAWAPCPASNSITLSNLTDGPHSLGVYTADQAGNTSGEIRTAFKISTAGLGTVAIAAPATFTGAQSLNSEPLTTDWMHWKSATSTTFDRAIASPERIGTWTKLGTGTVALVTSPGGTFSWSNATGTAPTGSASNGVATGPAVGSGFNVKIGALPSRGLTLRAYVGVSGAASSGQLKATLTGGTTVTSAPVSSTSGIVNRVITIKFRRTLETDVLSLDWVKTAGTAAGSSVVLYAVALA